MYILAFWHKVDAVVLRIKVDTRPYLKVSSLPFIIKRFDPSVYQI